jgi:glycosyltransferase involved in cell wall biosynthesis
MRVSIFTDSPIYGGHEEMLIRHLCTGTRFPGVHFDFVFASGNVVLRKKIAELRDCGIISNLYEVPTAFSILDQFRLFYSVTRTLRLLSIYIKTKPDLVINIAGRIESCNLSLWISKLLRIPVACYLPMVHTRSYAFGCFGDAARDCFNYVIYQLYDYLIVLTYGQRQQLKFNFFVKKIAIVPNFISLNDITESPYKKPSTLRLGYLGRLENRQKNVLGLVPLFLSILKKHPSAKLIIQGEGPSRPDLFNLIKYNSIEGSVDLRPWQDDVERFYSDVDIVLLPSKYEGVSLVMLQALLRSKPVIATNNYDFAEFLPIFTLFNPGSENELVDVLDVSISREGEWNSIFSRSRKMIWASSRDSKFHLVTYSMILTPENRCI